MAAPSCISCEEDIEGLPVQVLGDTMCEACFRIGILPQFQQALDNELNYPVTYVGQILRLQPFAQRFFPDAFVNAWRDLIPERNTLPANRLYCAGPAGNGQRCNRFLGQRQRHRTAQRCAQCDAMTCGRCDTHVTVLPHNCADREVDDSDPFASSTRGVDYQRCPICNVPVFLGDGCNHMTCRSPACRASFCYICGRQAAGDSGHWGRRGGCPQYGARPAVWAWDDAARARAQQNIVDVVDPLDRHWLMRGMAPMVRTRVLALPHNQAHVDPERMARDQIRRDFANIRNTLEDISVSRMGRRMAEDMRHLGPLLNLNHMVQDGFVNPRWIQRAVDLAVALADSQRIYVRHLITFWDIPFGEDYWAPLLPGLIQQVNNLAQFLEPRTWARFPALRAVLRRWRLAAAGDFAALLALPDLVDFPPHGNLPQ